jgi:hypothetical protein
MAVADIDRSHYDSFFSSVLVTGAQRLEVNMILNDLVAHCSPKAEMKHVAFLNNIVQAFINGDHVDYNSLLTNVRLLSAPSLSASVSSYCCLPPPPFLVNPATASLFLSIPPRPLL